MTDLLDPAVARASAWALVVVPALVGAWLAWSRPAPRLAVGATLVTSAAAVLTVPVLAAGEPVTGTPFVAGSELALRVDPLAAVTLLVVTVVTFLVLVFAAVDVEESPGRFHGLMLLFAAAVHLTVMADSLPTLLLAWEVMGATSYALIGFWWREQHRVRAGLVAFVTTRTADLGLYVAAAAALAGGAATLGLTELTRLDDAWRDVAAAGILVAALGKAAQLPFSFWLSGAMQGPSPVSALLHSAAMVAMGGYLLLRVEPLLAATGWAATTAAWVGVTTAVVLGVVAVFQSDLKQLLAASTAAQLGFVVMAAGVGSVTGGAAHLVGHAATKAALFLAAGAWLALLGTKALDALGGAARRFPALGAAAVVATASLAGLPPLALWATKDLVLASAVKESAALYVAGLLAAVLAAAYAGRLGWILLQRPQASDEASTPQGAGAHAGPRAPEAPAPAMLQPVVLLAAAAALVGGLALPAVETAFAEVLGAAPVHPAAWELVLSAALAIGVVAALARLPVPSGQRWAESWLGLEQVATAAVARPVDAFAVVLARFDDRVLDRSVMGTARGALRAARASAWFDDAVIDGGVDASARLTSAAAEGSGRLDRAGLDGAVEAVAAGVRRLGRLAPRPQTGQLHQYYLQALAVLFLAVLLVLVVR